MHQKQPPRLTSEQFMALSPSFRIYRQTLLEKYELHWHEFYELTFVLGGHGTNVVNGVPHRLSEGSLFLLTPADFHEIFPDPGGRLELFNVIFSDDMIIDELRELLFRELHYRQTIVSGDDFDELERYFRRIWDEFHEEEAGQRIMVKAALLHILVELARRTPTASPGSSGYAHAGIRNVLIHLHHHFREPLTLAEAASKARLAPNYFSECFRKMTGASFQSYVQGLRLRFAKSLLSASDLTVTEVCYASGFNTLTHFARAFKRKYGGSPGSCRRGGGKRRQPESPEMPGKE